MKRARVSQAHSFSLIDGDLVSIASFNFPDYAWGWKEGDSSLSIVRTKKHKRILTVVGTQLNKGVCLGIGSGLGFIGIDEDSSQVTVNACRTYFIPEVIDDLGTSFVVRFVTKDKKYLRHCNYVLQADEFCESDKPFLEDSKWILHRVENDSVSTAPPSPAHGLVTFLPERPLFIHIQKCFKDTKEFSDSLNVMISFITNLEKMSAEKPRVSNIFSSPTKVMSYSLQGAGGMGMEAGAFAISMHRPGELVSGELKKRIEDATTVKSRGGMGSFTPPSSEVETIINKLSMLAINNMTRLKMFGMTSRRKFELKLGFCEWVILPHGKEIVSHRDGGNDCDVAAIFACTNSSDVSVEGSVFTLKHGEMYIFEPQKYIHSVSKPHEAGSRIIVALRFFRIYDS